MKIRARLSLTAVAGLLPMLVGIIVITVIARRTNMEDVINLMEENARSIAASISSFFGDASDAASYMALMQGDGEATWLGNGGGLAIYLPNL